MNIIEEIETLKKRIETEVREHWTQITMLVSAADSLGYKIQLPPLSGMQVPSVTSTPVVTTPMTAPGYQKVPEVGTSPNMAGAPNNKPVKKNKRATVLKGAGSKVLRALSQGHITSTEIARILYNESNSVTEDRARALLYALEKTGRVSSILLDENKTFGRRKAWTITQKGRDFLNSQS